MNRSRISKISGILIVCLQTAGFGAWVNVTGNLAGTPTECGDIASIYAVPNVNEVITPISNNGLWASTDDGANWAKIGGKSGDTITIRMTQMLFDPVNTNTWYIGGIYHQPGVLKTTDGGASWIPLGDYLTQRRHRG